MNFLGEQNPKIVFSGSEIDLPHTILNPSFISGRLVQFVSKLTGIKTYRKARSQSEFSIVVNLWKYDNAETKFNEIYATKNQFVTFYSAKDADALPGRFYVADVKHYPLTSAVSKYDVCEIKLMSEDYVKLWSTSSAGYGFAYGANYGGGL